MSAWIHLRNMTLDVPVFLPAEGRAHGWRGLLVGAALSRTKRGVARLLDDITLDIEEGDRLAILGRNGAGKSTLLRVLNGVYQPTQGSISVCGTRQALLNIALGFNGDATVFENILLRGSAMGVSASFLMKEVDGILEFAGLQAKSNHLLRTLSAGQRLRLGFAISTSVQHDIMLMDEWVGTGDTEFMAKAKERMSSRVDGSKIVVLASHSAGLLRDVCNKGIVLEQGRLLFAGEITSALAAYHEIVDAARHTQYKLVPGADTDMHKEEGSAHVFGAIEHVEKLRDGCFVLKGWVLDGDGAGVLGIAVELDGIRHRGEVRARHARPDVQRHFGLVNNMCGLEVLVEIPSANQVSDLEGATFFGGRSSDSANAPLRLASSVRTAMTHVDSG